MPDVDPDQLLKELDAKLALMRSSRARPSMDNRSIRIAMMVAFCIVSIMVLWGLQAFLSQLVPTRRSTVAPTSVSPPEGR